MAENAPGADKSASVTLPPIGGAGYNRTLLVIGREDIFSDMLMAYAVGMAARMEYSIFAVNLLTVPERRKRYLESKAGMAEYENFKKLSERSVFYFAKMAAESGVDFESAFHAGNLDDVVRRIYRERGDIDLTIIEPEYMNESADGPLSIPAFTLTPGSV